MAVFDSAEQYYFHALELLKTFPDTVQILNIYQNLSYNMILKGDKEPENKTYNEQSIFWSNKTIELVESYNFHKNILLQSLSAIYYNLAESHLELGLENYLKTSQRFIQKAQSYAVESDYSAVILVNYCLMAHIKAKAGDIDSAIILYKIGLHEAEQSFLRHSLDNQVHRDPYFHNLYYEYSYKIRVQWAYDSLYRTYKRVGDSKNALQYYILKEKSKEEIHNENNKKLIAILEADSENERDQTLILKLQNKNLILKNQNITYLSGGSGLALIFLFIFAYSRQRNYKNRIISEQKIVQLEEEKKLLAAKSILEGQEEERKRIARELHDGLGVLLSSAKMHFTSIRNKLPEVNHTLEKATKLLEEASSDVRRISHNMMPGLLTKYGLYEAVEDLFEQIDEMEDMHAEIKIEGDQSRMKENIEIMLYRILQEMVNNTLKHAEAKNIALDILIYPNKLNIKYSDDGKGFDYINILGSKSMGLSSLQSRIKLLGGEMSCRSSPGQGTSYSFDVVI
jgi:signal transduction histidine kinase